MEMNDGHSRRKRSLMANQRSSEIGPVVARLQHQNLDRDADSVEVALQRTQISSKNLAALCAEFASHFRSETGLAAKEFQIFPVQQPHHGPVALDREFVNPIRS